MVDYFVTNTDGGANLRDAPDSGAIKRNLPFGTALTSIPGSTGKWKSVETDKGEKGYVSDKNLTVPASDAIVRLIQSAAHYWEAFAYGKGKEDTSPYYDLVVEIWKELGQGMPPFKRDKKGEVLKDKNGNDIYNTSHPDWPWSAAGMSAFIRRAKGYKNFQFSRLHATYIHNSIVARKAKNPDGPVLGVSIERRGRPCRRSRVPMARNATGLQERRAKCRLYVPHRCHLRHQIRIPLRNRRQCRDGHGWSKEIHDQQHGTPHWSQRRKLQERQHSFHADAKHGGMTAAIAC
ncbi:SH3 domain-containing protein [Rhizobium ruizarguesonis]|nr:SH3 domain-containing protein [Rhizobium ruizarguesonis]